jgi:DNA end-binding protein Ku
MATKLVDEMSDSWKPAQYKDTYHDDLMRLINKRIKAGKTEVVTAPVKDEEKQPTRAKVVDLMALLKRSVQQSGKPKRQTAKSDRHMSRKTA